MIFKSSYKKISIRELLILLVILLSGAFYVYSIWADTKNQLIHHVLQVAESVEASLPTDEYRFLTQEIEDLKDDQFKELKATLQKVLAVNKDAQFAYIYIERDGSLYFVVDSEEEGSPDYSPAGQEFTEAAPVDFKPFTEGKSLVTKPVTDRWGTWVSAEVPVKDPTTGKIIATFGMDYNAKTLKNKLLFEVSESSLMVIIILILGFVSRCSYHNNVRLKEENTQRIKAENSLRENEQTLSNLISNLPGMIYRCALDKNYTINFISDASTRITGYTPDDFIDNKVISFNDIISPDDRDFLWEKWIKAMNEKSIFEAEYEIKTASGETKWLWERGKCIYNENDEVQFLEGYIEDITEIRKAELELVRAKEKAEESERLKSVFLANISHEIRTPMNGILGFAELLKEPDLTPENQQEFISIIEANLYRMLQIISDLIEISKIEAGEMVLNIQTININSVFRHLHQKYTKKHNHNNIPLSIHCDLSDEECYIETDSNKFNKIMSNLIKNALKFTEQGTVAFGYRKTNSVFEFFVTDTGPGIHPHVKDMIFDRFVQADQGTTRKYEGVGLGLSISKAYAVQLGGTIRVESEIDKGSTFIFELPYSV